MIIRKLGERGLMVRMNGLECEQMARFLTIAASTGCDGNGSDAFLAETLSGLFLAAAVASRTHGYVNIPEEATAHLDAIRTRVQREEE